MKYNILIRIGFIVAILGILAGILIPWYVKNVSRGTFVEQIKVHQDSAIIAKAQIKATQARETALLTKLHTDSLKGAEVIQRKDKAIQRLYKKLAEKRPEVEAQIDSLPDVKDFVVSQDSLNYELQVEVDSLKGQKIKTWQAFNRILTASDDKYKMSQELNNHMAKINEIQADELVKKKRQNVGLKVGIVVLAVLAILK